MTHASTLAPVGAWFILGMTRMVFMSRMGEHRIDRLDPAKVTTVNPGPRSEQFDEANYDSRGRHLLPWYRAVDRAYWVVAGGALLWTVLQRA
jgi:hypothetical protein